MAPETRVMYGWTGHRERDGKGGEGVRLLALLKKMEMGRLSYGIPCYACSNYDIGHKAGCELKAAIDHFERVEQIPPEKRTIEDIHGGQFNPLDHEGMK